MQQLIEILLTKNLEDRVNSRTLELRNLELHKQKIRMFSGFFKNFSLPVYSTKYNGKIMYVSFILRQNRLYLSLNISYDNDGVIVCVESLSHSRAFERLYETDSIRTLGGKKLMRQIDVSKVKDKIVNVVDTKALFLKSDKIRIIENGLEKFAARDKIMSMFDEFSAKAQKIDVQNNI